ncbi:MAG TPA: hypothetical protein VEG66_09595, partial [Thermoplasmata archaeon]|nr:hypothetical protein [Thermoplasmata archaeon]
YEEILVFAGRLAARSGFRVLDESPDSKVVLLGRTETGRFLPGRAPLPNALPMTPTVAAG